MKIDTLSTSQLGQHQEEILDIYRAAFAALPYARGENDTKSFARQLAKHQTYEGFRLIIAREEHDLLGFAYGYAGKPDYWWRSTVSQAMDAATVEVWLSDYFEVVELAVHPKVQGRGLGGRLHDTLLSGLPQRTAALSTAQAETPALALYKKRGWQTLLRDFYFPGGTSPNLVMGIKLAL